MGCAPSRTRLSLTIFLPTPTHPQTLGLAVGVGLHQRSGGQRECGGDSGWRTLRLAVRAATVGQQGRRHVKDGARAQSCGIGGRWCAPVPLGAAPIGPTPTKPPPPSSHLHPPCAPTTMAVLPSTSSSWAPTNAPTAASSAPGGRPGAPATLGAPAARHAAACVSRTTTSREPMLAVQGGLRGRWGWAGGGGGRVAIAAGGSRSAPPGPPTRRRRPPCRVLLAGEARASDAGPSCRPPQPPGGWRGCCTWPGKRRSTPLPHHPAHTPE